MKELERLGDITDITEISAVTCCQLSQYGKYSSSFSKTKDDNSLLDLNININSQNMFFNVLEQNLELMSTLYHTDFIRKS